jgi:large subunit ribosomal protein L17
MRHRVKGRKLSRTRSHRVSTLRSLATALIRHKKITTTLAKAKEAKRFIEPLITKAKDDTVHSKRLISRHIKDREVLTELFTEVVGKVGDRPGGYTRVVKLGTRLGDAAEMAILELVDFNELVEKKKKKAKPAAKKAKSDESKAAAPAEIEEAEVLEETELSGDPDEKAEDVVEEVKDKKAKDEKPKTAKPKAEKAEDKKPKAAKPKTEKAKTEKPAKESKKSEKKEDK